MAWKLAKSLDVLRAQINDAYPNRNKASDGTIGNPEHSSRLSDHNPNAARVVCALDITHDPAHGLDAGRMAGTLRLSKDIRIKYLISNGRISNPSIAGGAWRKYSGKNPHDHHFHISVKSEKADVITPWDIGDTGTDIKAVLRDTASPKPVRPFLVKGTKGPAVELLQKLLSVKADGEFGPKTEAAVKAFQKKSNLVVDGKVGAYSWAALEA